MTTMNALDVAFAGGQIKQPYDAVIYGGSIGAVACAIDAKRAGAKVLLVNPYGRWGGMTTGGLSNVDIIPGSSSRQVVGAAREFFKRTAKYYDNTYQFFFKSGLTAVPSVNAEALAKWMKEASIDTAMGRLVSIEKSDDGFYYRSLVFDTIGRVEAAYAVDATYEGDLVGMTGVSVQIGRESAATYSESQAGTRIGSQAQYLSGVSPYVIAGDAGSGLLPGVTAGTAPTDGTASPLVQGINFRLCLTKVTANQVAWPEPTAYDATKYELLGRHAAAGGVTAITSLFQPTLLSDGTKYDFNNSGPMSTNFRGPEATEYITATWERRAEIKEMVKQWILGLVKFLKTDSRIPSDVKTAFNEYGLCKDEFQENGGFSPELYVRTGRRMVGDYVLKQGELTSNSFTDEVAYVEYQIDGHHVATYDVGGVAKNEGYISGTATAGGKIPYRIMYPKAAEFKGLLSCWSVSASYVAFMGLRLEPVHIALGGAAGIAIAHCSRQKIPVQDMPISLLRERQNIRQIVQKGGFLLSVEAGGTNGTITETGTWNKTGTSFASISPHYWTSAEVGAKIRFTPTIKQSGQYDLFINFPTSDSYSRSTAVPVTIVHAGGTTVLTIDQTNASSAPGGDMLFLGTFAFSKGGGGYVEVGADGVGGTSCGDTIKGELLAA